MNQAIILEAYIANVQNEIIQTYESSTLNFFNNSIESDVIFGNIIVEAFFPEESRILNLNSVIDDVNNDQIQTYESTTLFELNDLFDNSIDSTEIFGIPTLNYTIFANSIENTNSFEQNKVNFKLFTDSINPSALFGNLQTNMQINDVPFPSIDSTAIVPIPNVLKVIGPLSIAPTASFGVASFIDNIHRILIFKDDNISKVGENDATVIAGGIRLNPASVSSETASAGDAILPEAPVGFLSVNINGTDYKIPYYNS